MRKFYSSCVALGLSVTAVIFGSSFAQGQGGALWQPSGQNAAYTMRSIAVKTSSPLYDADINGSFHSRTATVDSLLNVWKIMVSDALSVGGKLTVGGSISAAAVSVTGLAESGSIITGNIISTNVNADSLNSNYITTTTVNSQSYYYNGNLINIPQIQSDIQNGKAKITALQTTAAIHDSLLSNITSSQWQNNDTNIYFNSGFVGIGTTEPSEMLEINGRVKITGNAPSDSVTPPTPAPNKSIIIDGGIDRITATSGTLDFDNTNLTTTGNIQSASITTTNITITDNIKTKSAEFDTLKVIERMQVESSLTSDTLHALKSLEVNNSLRLLRDTAEMYAEVSTNDTAVALMLQKDPSASVEIGEAAPTPAGEARAKLTVEGNTRLNGELKVSGEVHANCVRTDCLHVTGETSFDSLKVANKIKTARIVPLDGDSIIRFGKSTLFVNTNSHFISTDNDKGFSIGWLNNWDVSTYQNALAIGHFSWAEANNAISIGNFSRAKGINSIVIGSEFTDAFAPHSIAIGYWIETDPAAQKSIVIGSGSSNSFINDKPNSLMVGFNTSGNTPTLFVGPASGTQNSIGDVGIGTSSPSKTLDVAGTFRTRSDATFDTKIILEPNATLENNTSTAKLTFNAVGAADAIGLGYGTDNLNTFQGIGIAQEFTSGIPGGVILLRDPNPDGQILLSIGGISQIDLNAKQEYIRLENSSGDHLFMDGVNNYTEWSVPRGLKIDGSGSLNPNPALNLSGKFRLQDGTQVSGHILTTNADGDAQWTDPTTITTQNDGDWVISGTDMYSGVSGSVGVGTTSPSEKLHVIGNSIFDGDITTSSLAGTGNRMVIAGQDGKLSALSLSGSDSPVWSTSGNSGTNPSNHFIGTTDATDFVIKTNNTERMYFNNTTGFVGIGTTSPNHELSIHNPSQFSLSNSAIHLSNGISGGTESDGLKITSFGNSAVFSLVENGAMHFIIGENSLYAMTIISSGDIGIGTITPLEKLDVRGIGLFSDKIGIGTTTPSEKLDVTGSIKSSDLAGTGNRIVTADEFGKLTVNAPSVSTNWNLNGNAGTTPSTNFIGTSDAQGLAIKTNNQERILVTSSGNVGIGTTNPERNLHLRGISCPACTATNPTSPEHTTFFRIEDQNINAQGTNTTNSKWDIAVSGSANRFFINQPGQSTGVFTITSDENVGIGTTSPAAKLHLSSPSAQSGSGVIDPKFKIDGQNPTIELDNIKTEGAGTEQVNFQIMAANGAARLISNKSVSVFLNGDNDETNNFFDILRNNTFYGTPAEVIFRLQENGNLGIGTTSPNAKLVVADNTMANAMILHSGNSNAPRLNLVAKSDEVYIEHTYAGSQVPFHFKIGGTNAITINNGANVGIGTTNPEYKLDVNGTIRMEEGKVCTNGCDFVFEPTYGLLTLAERKKIITKQKHLLNIKPATDMQQNGAGISETMTGILQNVEEHELYLYEHDEKINTLQLENKELKSELVRQLTEINELKKAVLELKKADEKK